MPAGAVAGRSGSAAERTRPRQRHRHQRLHPGGRAHDQVRAGLARRERESGVPAGRSATGPAGWFRTVLSPDYNRAHADHLHFDMGGYEAVPLAARQPCLPAGASRLNRGARGGAHGFRARAPSDGGKPSPHQRRDRPAHPARHAHAAARTLRAGAHAHRWPTPIWNWKSRPGARCCGRAIWPS